MTREHLLRVFSCAIDSAWSDEAISDEDAAAAIKVLAMMFWDIKPPERLVELAWAIEDIRGKTPEFPS